jgi:hypothetical protein
MADLNANINVGIETTQALDQLKALQRQISQFHQSVSKSSAQASLAQRDLQKNFLNGINSIQGFSAELKTVRTTAESFTNSLEKNKFSMREYFRYSAGATKTFGKNFVAEMATIERTAIERVKTLQTQYIKMGRDASGAMKAIAVRPTVLNMQDLGTQTAIAGQKQAIFNQLLKQGSTNLLNFGKNTQWAGRQLMVGFTLPLATLGMTAGRVFFDMEKAAIKFKKVYGDLFTAPEETKKAMDSIVALGEAYTSYGIAVSDTLDLAADAAAAGFAGVDLQNQTTAALKLSVLGQMELQKSLETTISLQNAFQLSSSELAGEIDFLNAVENQTVVSLDDITEAVPRVAPVIQALGGDVRDLAFFLAAMKEGGINAAQGANALKSGLASLINPTEVSSKMLAGMGINIRNIISQNQGDLAGTVSEFALALDKLDPLKRAQAIEQLFGKFQFARISALFDNITRDGTQAQRVLELAGASMEELAALSEGELGVSAASSMNKFRAAVEQLKLALAPIGELFVQIATPFVEFGTKVLEAFNSLPGGIKTAIGTVITILGGIGPIALMTFGLINNGIANMIKFFATVRLGYLKITGQAKGVGDETQYMTQEQLEAAAAAASLDQAHAGLTQRFTLEKAAVDALTLAYQKAAAAGASFALNYPGSMKAPMPTQAQGFAKGGVVSGPGTGTSDSIPALLSNGEAVIPAKQAKQYAPIIQGMIAGNLPGFAKGVMLGMPRSGKSVGKNRDVANEIYEDFLKSSYANVQPTNYGHQISKTSGHSFPIFGLGGVYSKSGGEKVFVKPVLDEAAAVAEIRATQIARQVHGLEAPEQKIVVIKDPLDPTGERRFLALESALDTKFIQNEPKAIFNEDQYFRQLVASLLRVDKDLSASNVFGNVVADVGPSGVFDRASGKRTVKTDLPSMEDQALINLLGIKGGAKRAFAESTLALMAGLSPQQYHQRMIGEIQKALPALRKTVAEFGLSNPAEIQAYDAMIKRLETGLTVDWSKFHSIHSNVKITVPKPPKAVNLANGGMVRGPGGPKDDAIPANLSNGEAVIDAATVKKNPGIIAALFQKKRIAIPGYAESNGSSDDMLAISQKTLAPFFGDRGNTPTQASHFQSQTPLDFLNTLAADLKLLGEEAGQFRVLVRSYTATVDENGKVVHTAKDEVMSLSDALKRFNKEGVAAAVGGKTFGGTAVVESGVRNQKAYGKMEQSMSPTERKSMGTLGAPESLRDVEAQGRLAARALEKFKGKLSEDVERVLNNIVSEGKAATEALKSTTASEQDLEFMMSQKEKSLKLNLEYADPNLKGIEKEKRLAQVNEELEKIKRQYYQEVAEGMSEQDALNKAQARLRLLAIQQSKLEGNENVALHLGEVPTSVVKQGATGRLGESSGSGRETLSNIKDLQALKTGRSTNEMVAEGAKAGLLAGAQQGDVVASRAEQLARNAAFEILDSYSTGITDGTKDFANIAGQELLNSADAASPSQKTIQATNAMVDGVTETLVESKTEVENAAQKMVSSVTKPMQNARSGSAFGNINTKEPVPAVGNAPRAAAPAQVVQAMSQEATATKTFIGSIKQSFATMRANLARELGWVKEEFKTVAGGIKTNTAQANQEVIQNTQKNIEINRAANNQIISDNQKAGFNYIAAMQGRNGAVEAILTRGNAAIIAKATEQFNVGSRLIPKLIADGLKSSYPEFEFAGKRIGKIIAENAKMGAQAALPAGAPEGAVAGDPTGPIGPSPASGLQKFEASFARYAQGLSQFSMSLSAVSGIMYMFGGEVGQAAGYISAFSGGVFALVQVLDQMIKLQLIAKAMEKVKIIQNVLEVASRSANIASMGFFTAAATVAGVALTTAFSPAIAIFIALAALIAVITAGFFIYNGLVEAASFRINGLADAAFVAGEKLKAIANVIGFEPTRDPATTAGSIQDFSGLEAGAASGAREIGESQEFKDLIGEGGAYKKDLDALKNATVDEAQAALNSLITQLIAVAPEDFDVAQIQAFAAAVAAEAGKTDLDFSLAVQLNPYVAENADLVIDLANQQAAQIAEDYESSLGQVSWVSDNLGAAVADGLGLELNEELQKSSQIQASSLNSYFEQLQTGLLSGTLDTQTYLDKTEALLGTLSSMPEIYALDVLDNMLTNVGIPTEKLAGITDFANKLAVSQALLAGADVSDEELKAIDAADNMFASPEQQEAGLQALRDIEARKVQVVEESAAAIAAARAAENAAKASTDMSIIEQEIQLNRDKIAQARALIAAGMDEADAIAAVTDEVWQNIFAQAKLDDMKNDPSGKDTTNQDAAIAAYDEQKESVEALNDTIQAGNLAQYLDDAAEDTRLKGELTQNNFSAADSLLILNNEMLRGAYVYAAANGELEKFKAQLADFKEIELTKGGGSGKKSPFQEAIDKLKEQRQEIKNTVTAYAGLRSAGFGVAEAAEIAKDSMLAAALASQKVGSAGWNQLVTAIRAARAEEEAWLQSTPEGRAEHFSKVYAKVMDVFEAQEAILEMNNKAATATNRAIIETLEKQIEAYERRASELQRDLDKIAEKEDQINKAYDEKNKALEKVKKLNQDIINQQKSQLSIADALSKGDISAAASAMQDASAQFASSQGDATQRGFDAARQAELDGLTQNGKTRVQIEAEIKQIKKDISAIEFGALQTARDAVAAADEALEKAKENLTVQGKTRDEWENINTRIEASSANAALYEAEVLKALTNAQGLVGEWSKLNDTFTTTHVVNTVYNGTPSAMAPAPAASVPGALSYNPYGTGATTPGAVNWRPYASGGYISGPGTGTSDSIPAMLSDGEYVIKAAAVNKLGKGFLDAINSGKLPGFKKGGSVADAQRAAMIADKKNDYKPVSSAPSKAGVARKTTGAAATPTPSIFEKALDFASMVSPIVAMAREGFGIAKSLGNLGRGKATAEDYMVLGMGALNFVPGGRGVSTGIKAVQAIRRASPVSKVDESVETLPIDEISNMYSKEFGRAGNVTTNYWVDKGLMSQAKLDGLRASIAREGITTPLRIDKVRGMDVLIDGHHRLAIARELGIKNIPIQRFNKGGIVKPSYYAGGGMVKPSYYAKGGMVKPSYFAGGGMVKPNYFENGGFVARGSDTTPAMLTPGEFVVNKKSSKAFAPLLSTINNEGRSFALPVYPEIQRDYAEPAISGGIYQKNEAVDLNAQVDNSVYNYSLSVNVSGTNANANDIANVVMNKIKTIESQQVKRQVLR